MNTGLTHVFQILAKMPDALRLEVIGQMDWRASWPLEKFYPYHPEHGAFKSGNEILDFSGSYTPLYGLMLNQDFSGFQIALQTLAQQAKENLNRSHEAINPLDDLFCLPRLPNEKEQRRLFPMTQVLCACVAMGKPWVQAFMDWRSSLIDIAQPYLEKHNTPLSSIFKDVEGSVVLAAGLGVASNLDIASGLDYMRFLTKHIMESGISISHFTYVGKKPTPGRLQSEELHSVLSPLGMMGKHNSRHIQEKTLAAFLGVSGDPTLANVLAQHMLSPENREHHPLGYRIQHDKMFEIIRLWAKEHLPTWEQPPMMTLVDPTVKKPNLLTFTDWDTSLKAIESFLDKSNLLFEERTRQGEDMARLLMDALEQRLDGHLFTNIKAVRNFGMGKKSQSSRAEFDEHFSLADFFVAWNLSSVKDSSLYPRLRSLCLKALDQTLDIWEVQHADILRRTQGQPESAKGLEWKFYNHGWMGGAERNTLIYHIGFVFNLPSTEETSRNEMLRLAGRMLHIEVETALFYHQAVPTADPLEDKVWKSWANITKELCSADGDMNEHDLTAWIKTSEEKNALVAALFQSSLESLEKRMSSTFTPVLSAKVISICMQRAFERGMNLGVSQPRQRF